MARPRAAPSRAGKLLPSPQVRRAPWRWQPVRFLLRSGAGSRRGGSGATAPPPAAAKLLERAGGASFKGRAAPRSGDFKECPALLWDRGRLRQNGWCTLQQPRAASSSTSPGRSAALSTLQSHHRPTKRRRQNASWTQSAQKCPKSEAPMKNKKKIASLFFLQLPSFCFPSLYIRCCRKMFSCTSWASTAWQL